MAQVLACKFVVAAFLFFPVWAFFRNQTGTPWTWGLASGWWWRHRYSGNGGWCDWCWRRRRLCRRSPSCSAGSAAHNFVVDFVSFLQSPELQPTRTGQEVCHHRGCREELAGRLWWSGLARCMVPTVRPAPRASCEGRTEKRACCSPHPHCFSSLRVAILVRGFDSPPWGAGSVAASPTFLIPSINHA